MFGDDHHDCYNTDNERNERILSMSVQSMTMEQARDETRPTDQADRRQKQG